MPSYENLSHKKVLIVDDNIMNRVFAKRILSTHEIEVTESQNGEEAIEELIKKSYDFILMDIQMPVMDGIRATNIIRTNLKIKTPIIALTGSATKQEIDLYLSSGMNAFLLKPFTSDQLLNTLISVSNNPNKRSEVVPNSSNIEIDKDYDLSQLYEISNGDMEFVLQMIEIFNKTISHSLKEMTSAYLAEDFETVSSVAHRIKPSIRNLKIKKLYPSLEQLEFHSEKANSTLIGKHLKVMTDTLNNVINALNSELE